jgi:hypothetical protein
MTSSRITALAAVAAIALLAGCGGNETPAGNDTGAATDYQAKLQAMAEGGRNATFIRAIRDAGFDCQHVGSSAFEGETNGAPTWSARCDDGSSWSIVIGEGGVAQVMPSEVLEAATSDGAVVDANITGNAATGLTE